MGSFSVSTFFVPCVWGTQAVKSFISCTKKLVITNLTFQWNHMRDRHWCSGPYSATLMASEEVRNWRRKPKPDWLLLSNFFTSSLKIVRPTVYWTQACTLTGVWLHKLKKKDTFICCWDKTKKQLDGTHRVQTSITNIMSLYQENFHYKFFAQFSVSAAASSAVMEAIVKHDWWQTTDTGIQDESNHTLILPKNSDGLE